MSKQMSFFLVATVSVLALTGCLQTRNEIRESENRRVVQDTTTSLQKANAENANRFGEVEASTREMSGRIEVLENKLAQTENQQGRSVRAVEEQLNETNKKVALLQEEVAKLEGQIASLSEQMAAAATRGREERAEEAKNDKRTSFDVAEEHFGKKEWRKAILNYQKYRDSFPKGKKFLEATYKIGVCFQELGMKDEARTFYEELIAKHSKSDEARRARIRLKKLK